MKFIEKVGAIIVSKDNNKILLIYEFSGSSFGYNIPKGTVNREQDSNLIDAIKREVIEETGLKSIRFKSVLGVYPKVNKSYTSLLTIFLYKSTKIENEGTLSNLNQEIDENILAYKWVTIQEFLEINKNSFVDIRVYNILHEFLPKILKENNSNSR